MQAVFLLPTCRKFYLYLNLVSSLPHITDSVQSLQNTKPQSDGLLKGAMQKSGEDSLGRRYKTTFVRPTTFRRALFPSRMHLSAVKKDTERSKAGAYIPLAILDKRFVCWATWICHNLCHPKASRLNLKQHYPLWHRFS